MKLRLISFAILALLTFASCRDKLTGPPTPTPSASDTIAYWTFDGNTKDVTRNGHDGIAFGTPDYYAGNRFGGSSSGTAIDLNSTSWVSVPDKADLDFTSSDSYTISAWVNLSGKAGSNYLAGGVSNIIDKIPTPNMQAKIQTGYGMYADSGRFGAQILDDGLITLQTNNPVRFGTWHMVTLVVAAHESVTLFLDSSAVDSKADTLLQTIVSNNVPILMGAVPGNSQSDSTSLDDILIVHHAMSGSEVSARFHEGGWYEHADTVASPQTGWKQGTFGTTQAIEGICFPNFPNGGLAYACGLGGTILQSLDSGKSWVNLTSNTTQDLYRISFAANANTGLVGGNNGTLLRTTDAGKTWASIAAPFQTVNGGLENIRDVKFLDATHAMIVGGAGNTQTPQSDGFIMTSADAGLTWIRSNTTSIVLYSIGFDPEGNVVHVVGSSGQILFSTDSGMTWVNQSVNQAGDDFLAIDYSPLNNFSYGMATTAEGAIYSDYSTSWTQNGMASSGVQSALRTVKLTSSSEVWIAGDNGIILHSTNSGMSWARADIAGVSVQWNQIAARDPNTLAFVGANGTLYFYAH